MRRRRDPKPWEKRDIEAVHRAASGLGGILARVFDCTCAPEETST